MWFISEEDRKKNIESSKKVFFHIKWEPPIVWENWKEVKEVGEQEKKKK